MYQAEEFVEGGYDESAYQPQFDAQLQFAIDQPTYQYVFGGAVETEEVRTTQTRLNVPDVVRSFLVYFERQVAEKNVMEIQNVYELSFNKLSERFYKNAPWPEVEHIEQIVEHDGEFIILYKELYFRHIYAKQQHLSGMPTLEQRFESYYNYCDLFNYILSAEEPVELELPNQWLWDIIDEFIYQFQSFCQYRCKLKNKSEDEIQVLRSNPMVWNVHSVLNVLHSLVEKSRINEQLQAEEAGEDPEEVAGDFGQHPLYKMLGYFSLVGLLRLHSLLGDYHEAIHALRHVQMNRKTLSAVVPGCQVTTYYYVGFAYLMMRRYQEAIQTFCNILLYVQRTKQLLQLKSVQFETVCSHSCYPSHNTLETLPANDCLDI
jgi:translation initiation factor 3 subunit L